MGLYTKAMLNKKNVAELHELIEQHSLEVEEDAKKPDLVEALLEVDEAPEVEEDEIEEDEVEEVEEEEEDDIDDPELPEADEVDEPKPKAAAKKSTAKKTKYTEGGTDSNGEKLLGAKEVATAIGTDAKVLRQFFRSGKSATFEAVGAGGRYEFKESDVEKIKAEFEAYKANKPGRGRGASEGGTKSTKTRGRKPAAEVETIDEVEEIEDLEDLDDDIEEADLEIEEELEEEED